jgi:hypothetical protein
VTLFNNIEKICDPLAVNVMFEFLFYDKGFTSKLESISKILKENSTGITIIFLKIKYNQLI